MKIIQKHRWLWLHLKTNNRKHTLLTRAVPEKRDLGTNVMQCVQI